MDARAKSSRWPRGSPWVFDGLLALGLAGLSVQLVSTSDGPVGAPAYALALLHTLPLALRRRFPSAVLATGVATWLGNTLVLGAAWLVGHFVHDRRVYAAQLEERTAQLEERTAQLEQAREELARRAMAEERLRIARELHDVVAHSLSVIAVQSGVGAHVAATQPEEARKA